MAVPANILVGLTRRYCEPHRHYHTIRHIAEMIWHGRELRLDDDQLLAIWYHDAIYVVAAADNERRSADLAVLELGAIGWPADGISRIERMVMDTAHHLPTCDGAAEVVDLDLASLAGEWHAFARNTAALRAEYACQDEATFQVKQRSAFERLLARDRIFHTEWGAALEASARRNLERSLGR